METVKSSEALEAQILEDAQAKARRIADSAQKEAAAVRAEADRRQADEAARMDAARGARVSAMRGDLEGSLPLDFKRQRLAFYQKEVSEALQELFDSLDPRELARIIGGQVARAAGAFAGQHVVVQFCGLRDEEAARIVKSNIDGIVVDKTMALAPDEAADAGKGLIVESADGTRRLRATLREITELLLADHREQLLKALFGKDVET